MLAQCMYHWIQYTYEMYGILPMQTGTCIVQVDMLRKIWPKSYARPLTFQCLGCSVSSDSTSTSIIIILICQATVKAGYSPAGTLGLITCSPNLAEQTNFMPLYAVTLWALEHKLRVGDKEDLTVPIECRLWACLERIKST